MTAGAAVSAGAGMFARYAYPPNALGYCGPEDASVLLDGASEHGSGDERIARHARQFEGAWAYLQLIAAAAGIRDPLDARVVEAYWIGNDLLDAIEPVTLMTQLQESLPAQAAASWMPGRAHHSYHVFAVYPWVRLLARAAGNGTPLHVLDQCRIRWGEVAAVEGERAVVRSQPLAYMDGLLTLGPVRSETAAWSVDGQSLLAPSGGPDLPRVRAGDLVALHWDWICDVLRPDQAAELAARSAEQLRRTNETLPALSR